MSTKIDPAIPASVAKVRPQVLPAPTIVPAANHRPIVASTLMATIGNLRRNHGGPKAAIPSHANESAKAKKMSTSETEKLGGGRGSLRLADKHAAPVEEQPRQLGQAAHQVQHNGTSESWNQQQQDVAVQFGAGEVQHQRGGS